MKCYMGHFGNPESYNEDKSYSILQSIDETGLMLTDYEKKLADVSVDYPRIKSDLEIKKIEYDSLSKEIIDNEKKYQEIYTLYLRFRNSSTGQRYHTQLTHKETGLKYVIPAQKNKLSSLLITIKELESKEKDYFDKIKEYNSTVYNLKSELIKLQKAYNDELQRIKIIKEEEQKKILEAELLRIQSENNKLKEQANSQATIPVVEKEVQSAVLDTTPAQIVREAPILKPDEQPKKSNTGLIVGAAALGIAAYFYTQD